MEFRIWSQHVLLVVLIICSQQRVSGRPTVKTGLGGSKAHICGRREFQSERAARRAPSAPSRALFAATLQGSTLSIRTPSSCPASRCTHPSRSQDEALMSQGYEGLQGVRVRKGSGSPAARCLTTAPAAALSSHASAPSSVKRFLADHVHARSRALASVAQS